MNKSILLATLSMLAGGCAKEEQTTEPSMFLEGLPQSCVEQKMTEEEIERMCKKATGEEIERICEKVADKFRLSAFDEVWDVNEGFRALKYKHIANVKEKCMKRHGLTDTD